MNTALELSIQQDDAESRGRNRCLLGQAYSEMGQLDKSLTQLELAIPDLETAREGRALRLALTLRADIERIQRKFEAMASDRARQEQYLATDPDRAGWVASKARDAAAQSNLAQAIDLYHQSAKLYATTAFPHLGQLAELEACALESVSRLSPACSSQHLQMGYQQIQSLQASIPALEGKYLWAKILRAEGKLDDARSVTTGLIDDLLFFQRSLPGVLGAWYLEARRDIFDFHMHLLLDSGVDNDQIAMDSLLALNRLSNIDLGRAAGTSKVGADGGNNESSSAFRVLLAQREQAGTTQAKEAVQRGIDLWLLAQNNASARKAGTGVANLRQQLLHLPADYSVLAYYFLDHRAYAWVGNAQGLTLHELGSDREIRNLVQKAHAGIRTFNQPSTGEELVSLGQLLIAPVQQELRFNVLFLGTGELSDFPLEALSIDDKPMIRSHRVVNILSINGLDRVVAHLNQAFAPHHLFLAGNPTIHSDRVQPLAGAARELAAIQKRFHDQDIVLVQGTDLTRHALDSKAFNSADLIHIASHATIDREYPELSRIMVSGSAENPLEFVTPAELSQELIHARLVVLSACSTVGLNRFEYDSDLGFVTRFLQLGSPHVMASLWPISDQATAEFLTEFYAQLASSRNVPSALRVTKLKLINAGQAGINQWAAFQLFSQ